MSLCLLCIPFKKCLTQQSLRQIRSKLITGRAITRTQDSQFELPALWPLRYNQLSQTSAHSGDNKIMLLSFHSATVQVASQHVSLLLICGRQHNYTISSPHEHTYIPWQILASASVPGAQDTLLNPVAHWSQCTPAVLYWHIHPAYTCIAWVTHVLHIHC